MAHYDLGSYDDFHKVELEETDSTNDYLKRHQGDFPHRLTLVTAEYQTAGRGATGRWQSVRGENLVFSLLVHPTMVEPARMFVLSEAICLAVCRALNSLVDGFRIKWPNDVYHGDQKVAGILIENELRGRQVADCVMGVGVNVNQRTFSSEAPNPSSLASITHRCCDRNAVLDAIVMQFDSLYRCVEQGYGDELHSEYLSLLYRKDAEHAYRDAGGDFRATLTGVEPDGHLLLRDQAGRMRKYAFKEVQYII